MLCGEEGRLLLTVAIAWLLLTAVRAHAVSYASSLSNVNGRISFRLNEAADRVSIIKGAATNALGPLPSGLHSVPLSLTGPFQVMVVSSNSIGFVTAVAPNTAAVDPVGSDLVTTRFNSPRGIAINTDPASPYFGRIYIANSAAGGATNAAFGPSRVLGTGLYVLNPDFSDTLGQGDLPRTGGLAFGTNSDLTPYRLSLGRDGSVYVCDFSQTSGSLYVVDADVSLKSGTNVLGGPAGGAFPVGPDRYHGSIAAAVVEGSLLDGNLTAYVIDEDLQSDPTTTSRSMLNSLWRHDLGGRLPGPEALPTLVLLAPWFRSAGQTMDVSRGPAGQFFVTDYRATGLDRAGLYALTPAGALAWNSLDQSRGLLNDPGAPDLLKGTGGGAISADGEWLAVIQQDTSQATLLPVKAGLPNLADRLSFYPFAGPWSGGRDVAFDAAGNLYVLSAGAQGLRAFSPGGITAAITGSDGTFVLIRPPRVSVRATVPEITEGDPGPASFSFHRDGATNTDLTVSYQLGGTAVNGVQYQLVPTSIKFQPGVADVELAIHPIDDPFSEVTMEVTLSLLGSNNYDVTPPSTGVIRIVDNDTPRVHVSAIKSSAFERLAGDRLVFEVERIGRTNTEIAVGYDLAVSSATLGVDFQGVQDRPLPAAILLTAGEVRHRLELEVLNDSTFEGTEDVVLRLFPGVGYAVGTPASAIGYILDDEISPVMPSLRLFEDNFETASASNWVIRFGANNGIYDAEVNWQFDYAQFGIPEAPRSAAGATHGLFVQVNKTNSLAGGSAGINFYPKDRIFGGDYALRFDLFVNSGMIAPTEHALVGLNHSGLFTNRVTQSLDPNGTTRGGDGVWFALSSDGNDSRNCAAYSVPLPGAFPALLTNITPAELSPVFPSPPYGSPGSPGNASLLTPVWTQVELAQIQGIITLKLNNQLVCSMTNDTVFTNGTVLIGLNDQFDSIGASGTFGTFFIFDNIEVVSYELALSEILLETGGLELRFQAPPGIALEDFAIESTPELGSAAWQNETAAVISPAVEGYRAVLPAPATGRFFRVRRGRLPP